jgi:hypothetical protein
LMIIVIEEVILTPSQARDKLVFQTFRLSKSTFVARSRAVIRARNHRRGPRGSSRG